MHKKNRKSSTDDILEDEWGIKEQATRNMKVQQIMREYCGKCINENLVKEKVRRTELCRFLGNNFQAFRNM